MGETTRKPLTVAAYYRLPLTLPCTISLGTALIKIDHPDFPNLVEVRAKSAERIEVKSGTDVVIRWEGAFIDEPIILQNYECHLSGIIRLPPAREEYADTEENEKDEDEKHEALGEVTVIAKRRT